FESACRKHARWKMVRRKMQKGEIEIVMSQASEYHSAGLNSQETHTVRSILPTAMEYWRGQNHD
ncbi:MAG: hypothetical protein ACRC52_19280, partial [Aeromonas veronii]